jgi:hypothetical protein
MSDYFGCSVKRWGSIIGQATLEVGLLVHFITSWTVNKGPEKMHFDPLTLRFPLKEGIRGESRAKDRVKTG